MRKPEVDLLFERVASVYAELLDDRQGKPVRVEEALDATLRTHAEYASEFRNDYLERLRTPEFKEYLHSRRAEYIVHTITPRLVAAELGSSMGKLALEQLLTRLTTNAEKMSDKSLLEIAKLGMDMANKIDIGEVKQTEGGQQSAFNQLIVALPDDLAQGMVQDLLRRARMKAVGDGS
jgi:hypothetical protein